MIYYLNGSGNKRGGGGLIMLLGKKLKILECLNTCHQYREKQMMFWTSGLELAHSYTLWALTESTSKSFILSLPLALSFLQTSK